jgi:subtilisin family serine protease
MMDTLIYKYDDALVLFAAGNNGGFDDTDDTTGDHSILDPGTSKNVLTVGAAETKITPSTVASFSSRGPTTGNRIKPEVCGPGNPIYSACSSGSPGFATCAVSQKSGTSMATPAVAGVAALVRQFLVDGMHEIYSSVGFEASDYNSSHPSSALLKAMLIGSTMPLVSGYDSAGNTVTLADFYDGTSPVSDAAPYALGTTGVDYHQGFGHVLLSNVLSLDGGFDTFLYESSLDAYGSYSLDFQVLATTSEIDITLVWTDPPGSPCKSC